MSNNDIEAFFNHHNAIDSAKRTKITGILVNIKSQYANDFKAGKMTKDEAKKIFEYLNDLVNNYYKYSAEGFDFSKVKYGNIPPKEEPKKRGRPAKSKPSSAPIEMDRNVYAHARIRKDDEYMTIIKDLWHKQIITTSKMNNMMGDLEDNKYDKLEKALSEYTKAKPVLQIPTIAPSPEPVRAPKKRGRPSKPVDTMGFKNLINEINEHTKYNPVTLASLPDFPKFPKAKPVKEPRSEIRSLKNNIKNKAKRMISGIEHSDLMKYIAQF